MTELFLADIEIGNCVAALDGAALGNSTAGLQERLGELGFSGVAWPDQAHVADVSCCIGHKAIHLLHCEIGEHSRAERSAIS